jgi:hypothetical protein
MITLSHHKDGRIGLQVPPKVLTVMLHRNAFYSSLFVSKTLSIVYLANSSHSLRDCGNKASKLATLR